MLNNEGYSLADIAAATGNEGFGSGNGAWWIIILFLFAFMNGGFGAGYRNNGDYGQYATAASQQQILFGQHFQNLYDTVDNVVRLSNEITYEEINERMLQLIEEVGELSKAIRELGKK